MRSIVWFREDLRIRDNHALANATSRSESTIGLFIIDTTLWKQHDTAACRVDFILRGLSELSKSLASLNIPLIIETVPSTQAIPRQILKIAEQHHAGALHFNKQYEVNEEKRDKSVQDHMKAHGITCHSYDDQLILPPNSVQTQQGSYFKVFSAYKRAWQQFACQQPIHLLGKVKPQIKTSIAATDVPKRIDKFHSTIPTAQWPAGEAEATRRLRHFIDRNIENYAKDRDLPEIEGTSRLSPYLSTGMISPRQCFLAALAANNNEMGNMKSGAATWMSELIWRDFYKQILISVPRISMNKAFLEKTENIIWRNNEDHLHAWQKGLTGIPIVDAAMRQLNCTGWMHNRLRMIVAMFLAKNLFLNWRLGEKYFMQNLIDGDLAANNGGWQWSASTGTDAAPYFRIFNPIRQSERFDPNGNFIRIYCPELKDIPAKAIHDPHSRAPSLMTKVNYPKPIVNLDITRKHAISTFRRMT